MFGENAARLQDHAHLVADRLYPASEQREGGDPVDG